MTRKLQILRGTTAQNNAYTGAVGELTMDTDRNEVRIHDGQTVGGIKIGDRNMPILTSMFFDHIVNDASWLRADTFSWQSGDVYVAAYNHLVGDYENIAGETLYAWNNGVGSYVYTLSESPSVGDSVYDSLGVLDSSRSVINVANGGIYVGEDEVSSLLYTRDSSIDTKLPQTETIGDITISYYLAEDGHKICLPDQESNLVALYESTGVAWYFILDTDNKQFKLPRENKDGKYLYFYVGNFEQDAVEQTAGLNAELFNNKADRNLLNTTDNVDIVIESQLPTADNGYTWYRKYKSGWVEQGGLESVTGHASSTTSNITLPIPMTDTNYTAYATINHSGETVGVACQVNKTSATNISLRIAYKENLTRNISWMVVGPAA